MALPDKHHEALQHLLSGKTVAETAKEIGMRRETVWRWTQQREFANLIESHRSSHLKVISEKMEALAEDAVDVLQEVMMNPESRDADRIRAAKEILDRSSPAKGVGTPVKIQAEVHQWLSGSGNVIDVD
jgi:transposase-like protein